jgi:hypothetical protein
MLGGQAPLIPSGSYLRNVHIVCALKAYGFLACAQVIGEVEMLAKCMLATRKGSQQSVLVALNPSFAGSKEYFSVGKVIF